jgi:hypothetical protein
MFIMGDVGTFVTLFFATDCSDDTDVFDETIGKKSLHRLHPQDQAQQIQLWYHRSRACDQ